MKTNIDIIAVFGVQAILWFLYTWWIALLSLPLAVIFTLALGLILMPLISKLVDTNFWLYYSTYGTSIIFGLSQFLVAFILSYLFL